MIRVENKFQPGSVEVDALDGFEFCIAPEQVITHEIYEGREEVVEDGSRGNHGEEMRMRGVKGMLRIGLGGKSCKRMGGWSLGELNCSSIK